MFRFTMIVAVMCSLLYLGAAPCDLEAPAVGSACSQDGSGSARRSGPSPPTTSSPPRSYRSLPRSP